MNITWDFSHRTVLVTGAAQGIGYAVARVFVDAGAAVTVVDADAERLEAAWGGTDRVLAVTADVSSFDAAVNAIAQATDRGGSPEIVVNNAGITRDHIVWKMTNEDWDRVLAVHLTGTFNFTRAAVLAMRERRFGRIINVTSYTGLHGNVGQANYAAAKAGIVGFTKTVAKEVAQLGITVNAVSPNAATGMVLGLGDDKQAAITARVPLGRMGKPAEMAPAVAFLASDEAAYITGIVLPVDGGLSM